MKARRFFAAAIFLATLAVVPTFAQDDRGQRVDGWAFSVEPIFGARLGQCKEIVWANSKTAGNYKLSELIYDITPAWYYGLDAQIQYKRFGVNLLSKFFIPSKTGRMTDSDWRNDSDCHNGDTSTKTDYSEHDLFLGLNGGIGGFDLELQTDFRFYPTSFLTLAPLLSFNAQYLKFSAKNGTGYYGNNNGSKIYPYDDASHRTVYDYDGMSVIDYDVYNFFVWTGLRADFLPCSWAKISLASEVAVFYLMMDYDKHLSNHQDFIDIAYSAFFAFRQTLKSEFKIKKFFSICQKTVFSMTGESKGAMYLKKGGESSYTKSGKAGGQLMYVDLELSLKFSW